MTDGPCRACALVDLPPCFGSGCVYTGARIPVTPVDLKRPTGRKSPRRPGMPESARLAAVSTESQKIGEFLEWLDGEGLTIAIWDDGELRPSYSSITKLLARYYGIDLERVERERRRLLAYIREKGNA